MKINCKADELSRGVQTIQSALSARTTLPILLNFLLETEKSKLKLISTDLQMGVKHYIPADVETDGSITIPAKKFSDILNTLPDNEDIVITMEPGGRVHVRCGRSRFIIHGTPKSEYPVLPEFDKKDAFGIAANMLEDMIKKTIFAASSDETRYVLNGVFWAGSDGILEMVATDGRRLAAVRCKTLPKDRKFRSIIPTKILHEVLHILNNTSGKSDDVLVSLTENQVGFQLRDTTMLSRLVEGTFPNYEQVVPVKKDICLTFPTKELLVVTKQASLCCVERSGSARYTLRKGVLHVSASSQTVQFEQEIAANYKGDEFTIAFNPQYILDGLRAIGTDNVIMSFTTPTNPVLMEPDGGEDYKYVVMPMRA